MSRGSPYRECFEARGCWEHPGTGSERSTPTTQGLLLVAKWTDPRGQDSILTRKSLWGHRCRHGSCCITASSTQASCHSGLYKLCTCLLQTVNKFTSESEIELQLPQQTGAEMEAVQEPPWNYSTPSSSVRWRSITQRVGQVERSVCTCTQAPSTGAQNVPKREKWPHKIVQIVCPEGGYRGAEQPTASAS